MRDTDTIRRHRRQMTGISEEALRPTLMIDNDSRGQTDRQTDRDHIRASEQTSNIACTAQNSIEQHSIA